MTTIVTDVDFRIIKDTSPATFTSSAVFDFDGEWSEARPSAAHKQPVHAGFGFVLHAPLVYLEKLPKASLQRLAMKGMRVEKKKPVFLKTETSYMRITFIRGDESSPREMYGLLRAQTTAVYKNWL